MDASISTEASPLSSDIVASSVSFLNERFRSREDLSQAKSLVSELEAECVDLDRNLIELNSRLGVSLVAYASFSDRAHDLFGCISAQLKDLESLTGGSDTRSDGGGERSILGEQELATLAREVARVETERAYAETALKLYILVEDIEEVVSFTLSKNLKKNSSTQISEEYRRQAIETLGKVEDIVAEVTKTRPRWSNLASAADHRVDRALAILRPQAISDHRAVLASLGWPPPLAALNSSDPYIGKSGSVRNPLFTLEGDLKLKYCENFLFLCHLQELQHRRKSRQLEGHFREVALRQPLWAIEELVNPVSLASERHFAKWIDKPEFIFALVYKITRDYVDSMDELLQPLVDEANLIGYSCREEWIASMISALSTYLAKVVFPVYVGQIEEEDVSGIKSPARSSWLHLVDLMISFGKRIKSLVSNSGISFSLIEEVNLQKLSSLSVFCDRPDWLDLWAQIELTDTLDKLSSETENVWNKKTQGSILMSGSENFRSPAISDFFLQYLSSVIDRSKALPLIEMRSKFLRLTSVPIIEKFLDSLLVRCQEAEGLTALTDDDALTKVAKSINASRHFESVLREWSEDVFFVEMSETELEVGIFDLEVSKLEKFREEWVEKLSVVVLRGFDSLSRDYLKTRKQWHENDEEEWTVSKPLVSALDYLQGKMFTLQESLNKIDFVYLWRRIAYSIDKLFLNGLLLSNTKFQSNAVERLNHDMEVLFGMFRSWCLRPEGFFPRISEGLKLLNMGEEQVRVCLEGGERGLKEQGIRVLSIKETEKILKNR